MGALALAIGGVFAATGGSAQAADFSVACGDNAALAAAITSANGTAAADAININGGPCTFSITTPSVVNATTGNNVALPSITQPLTINGNGATIERSSSATTKFRILSVANDTTLNDLTIKGGSLDANGQGGGGIVAVLPATRTLTLNRVTVTGNGTTGPNGVGGGIGQLGGKLVINDSTFTANSTKANGGAIYAATFGSTPMATTISGTTFGTGTAAGINAAVQGGAIYAGTASAAASTLDVSTSRFLGNTAFAGGATATLNTALTIKRSSYLFNTADNVASSLVTGGTALFENDTLASNIAGAYGIANPSNVGGIGAVNNGATSATVTVASTTIADSSRNGSTAPGSALATGVGTGGGTATINVTDTIITDTDSTAPVPTDAGDYQPCDHSLGGTINDQGGNLEWPGTSCGFATHADPKFKAYSFTTFTYGLAPGSPAIDLGGASGPATDEVGSPRPSGEAFDAGAIEAQIPQTTIDSAASPTDAPNVTFHSDVTGATFECRVDGGAWAACTSPFQPTGLLDGSHTADVRASAGGYTDATPASATFTVDNDPDTTITSGPSGTIADPSTSFAFTSNDPNATFECSLDGADFAPCTSPKSLSGYSEASHTFRVRAVDQAGHADKTPASRTFTYAKDTTPPETTITSGPSGTIYNTPSSTFQFTSNEAGSTFECRLDGGAFSSCTSPAVVTYAAGAHTFEVRATDAYGNTDPTPASQSFTSKTCKLLQITIILGKPIVLCV